MNNYNPDLQVEKELPPIEASEESEEDEEPENKKGLSKSFTQVVCDSCNFMRLQILGIYQGDEIVTQCQNCGSMKSFFIEIPQPKQETSKFVSYAG